MQGSSRAGSWARVVHGPHAEAICGVQFKALKTFRDERGFFREVVRITDPIFAGDSFAQWSHSSMQRDVVKAWHYHHRQTDWWYLPIGVIETVLVDFREESPTYRNKLIVMMGEADKYGSAVHEVCVKIPCGVLHGCRVLSDEAHLFYLTSQTYNPEDEGRLPYNSAEVGHDWGAGAITCEQDRRTFAPTAPREPMILS